MHDREQISDVLVHYATGIDSRNWDLFRSCFTEDCRLDYGPVGTWDNRETVTQYMILAHSGPSLHRLSNFAIAVDGDRATTRCYVDALVFGPGGFGCAHAIGYYDDELIRGSDGWRIAKRRYSSVSMKFLGILSIIPSWMILRLTALSSRRLNAAALAQSNKPGK